MYLDFVSAYDTAKGFEKAGLLLMKEFDKNKITGLAVSFEYQLIFKTIFLKNLN